LRPLLPSLISSVVGYSIFGFVFGCSPIFTIPVSGVVYQNPISLLLYAVVGLVCAPAGILYVKSFYGIRSVFIKLNHNIPNFVRPATGGVILGIVAIGFPQVLGPGYGWLQFAINGNYTLLPLWILLVLIFLKIFAT
jgi:CIC family chloride channel protein